MMIMSWFNWSVSLLISDHTKQKHKHNSLL
jgi:hypothetical protein